MQITGFNIPPQLSASAFKADTQTALKTVPPLDSLDISEAAYQRIAQLQQGNDALQQAVAQTRQAARTAAVERVRSAREYLKNLLRISLPGDRGAATEAARMAREIKSAATEFKGSIAYGEEGGIRSEIAGFAGAAGDALSIARGVVTNYLRKRKPGNSGDSSLEKDVSGAEAVVHEMAGRVIAPA